MISDLSRNFKSPCSTKASRMSDVNELASPASGYSVADDSVAVDSVADDKFVKMQKELDAYKQREAEAKVREAEAKEAADARREKLNEKHRRSS